jgi:hypothetical protein
LLLEVELEDVVERRCAGIARRAVLGREQEGVGLEDVKRAHKTRKTNGPMNDAPTVHSVVEQRAWVRLHDAARVQGSVGEGERREWSFEGTLYLGRFKGV